MQAGCHRFDPGQLHHSLHEGIEAETGFFYRVNLLEIESLLPVCMKAQTLILELVSSLAQCLVALQHLLPQTIFDN